MTDHKFTVAETVKALECCNTPGSCSECPYYVINEVEYDGSCVQNLIMDILPIINRQKAEIERLHGDLIVERTRRKNAVDAYREAKSEAIKDFAQRLKTRFTEKIGDRKESFLSCSVQREIDTLVKEMTEEDDESQNT